MSEETLALAGVTTLTSYQPPADLDFETWQQAGEMIGKIGRSCRWWLGDWVRHGETFHGDKYSQAIDATGFDYQTIANAVWVCNKIEPSRRRETLSFRHHELVAKFEPKVQDQLLDIAETDDLSCAELTKQLREAQREKRVKLKVYIASSWRNEVYPEVLALLTAHGYECYDFRSSNATFHWSDKPHTSIPTVDTNPPISGVGVWIPDEFRSALSDADAVKAYDNDVSGLEGADAVVLVLPCGRSAHLEAGYKAGEGKPVAIFIPGPMEPELMYKMGTICLNDQELLDFLESCK